MSVDKRDIQHQEPPPEPPVSPSLPVLGQPPQTPKGHDSEGGLSRDSTLHTDSQKARSTKPRDSSPPRSSQVADSPPEGLNTTTQTAIVELTASNRPNDAPRSNVTNARSLINQLPTTGDDGPDNNGNSNPGGSTSNAMKTDTDTGAGRVNADTVDTRPNSTTTSTPSGVTNDPTGGEQPFDPTDRTPAGNEYGNGRTPDADLDPPVSI